MTKILVVDDEEAIRNSVAEILEYEGFEVMQAENGQVALRLIETHPFDLMLIDLIMPVTEGIETIRVVHRKMPDFRIIAMSGGGRVSADNYLQIAAQFGACATLAKPFDRAQILAVVQQTLGRS
jgi:CheY-like chemotaxis protein